jgi:phospholipid/cholesterol/gamma-HCH transport system substrate-binding protein
LPEATSDTLPIGAAATEPVDSRRTRPIAVLALCLALAALLYVLFLRDDTYGYRFVFENAGQLVRGDVVRIGGTHAGTVSGIELTSDSKAQVNVSLDEDFAPLHQGTTATIRAQGLIGVANRYIDIHPGPNFRSQLDEGAVLDSNNTTAIVDLDQFFNTLDPPTRRGLQGVIKGFADWYEGKEQEANDSARYFSPALVAFTRFVKELNRDSRTFEQFLVETDKAMGALASRRTELTDLVGNTGATLRAISSDTESLSAALRELPPALRHGSDTFAALRPALDDIEPFVVESGPATRGLAPFMRRLAVFAGRSVPTFRQLRLMFARPGVGNDLYDSLRELPTLAKLSRRVLPRARRALRGSTPVFGFARPYTPDLAAWFRSFGQAMAPYDANGHYARSLAVFDGFNFVDDAQGGHLEPKPADQRGKSPYLELGNLRRCPGSAGPVPDGSAPFVDVGDLARPDCDPSQAVGAGP